MSIEINHNTSLPNQSVNADRTYDVQNTAVDPTSSGSSLSSGDSSFCGSVFNALVTPVVSFLTAVFHLITCEVFRSEAVRDAAEAQNPEDIREAASAARNAAEEARPPLLDEYVTLAELLAARNPRNENEIEERENAALEAQAAAEAASAVRNAAEEVRLLSEEYPAAAEAAPVESDEAEEYTTTEKARELLGQAIKELESDPTPYESKLKQNIERTQAVLQRASKGSVGQIEVNRTVNRLNTSIEEAGPNNMAEGSPVKKAVDIIRELKLPGIRFSGVEFRVPAQADILDG